MKELVIIGSGELAKEVIWLVDEINKQSPQYVIRGLIDKDLKNKGEMFSGYEVIGDEQWLLDHSDDRELHAIVAIQDPLIRHQVVERNRAFTRWESLIHPSSLIAPSSYVGMGSLVFPFSVVSVDTIIGDFSLCYLNCCVCNDCKIGDFSSIMSNVQISEHVTIGKRCFLGAGSCLYPKVVLGDDVQASVGAVIERNYGNRVKIEGRNGFHLFK